MGNDAALRRLSRTELAFEGAFNVLAKDYFSLRYWPRLHLPSARSAHLHLFVPLTPVSLSLKLQMSNIASNDESLATCISKLSVPGLACVIRVLFVASARSMQLIIRCVDRAEF